MGIGEIGSKKPTNCLRILIVLVPLPSSSCSRELDKSARPSFRLVDIADSNRPSLAGCI